MHMSQGLSQKFYKFPTSDTKTMSLSANIRSLNICLLLLFWNISKLAVDVLILTFQYTHIEVFL